MKNIKAYIKYSANIARTYLSGVNNKVLKKQTTKSDYYKFCMIIYLISSVISIIIKAIVTDIFLH